MMFTCMKNNSESNGGDAPRFSSTTTTTNRKPRNSVSNMIHAGLAPLQSVHSYSTNMYHIVQFINGGSIDGLASFRNLIGKILIE